MFASKLVRRLATVAVATPAVAGLVAITPAFGATGPTGPSIVNAFEGPRDSTAGNPDTTSAAGPTRVVEMVNTNYAVVDKSGAAVDSGSLRDISGLTTADNVTDPSVTWDPASQRFYYSFLAGIATGTIPNTQAIIWGFSKTATPNTAADWCSYRNTFNYGTTMEPDRPTLGVSNDFITLVSRRFDFNSAASDFNFERGAAFAWVSKPPTGSTCPAESTFHHSTTLDVLTDSNGQALRVGVAVRNVDPSSTGWILGQPVAPGQPEFSNVYDSALDVYQVTKDPVTGDAVLGAARRIDAPAYTVPPPAPQPSDTAGVPLFAETKEYMAQAYAAVDPRLGHVDIWSAHGVAGGAGAAARWYEIDPNALALDQSGTVSDPSLYLYDPSIAPDRFVDGSTTAFGSDMVLTATTSSETDLPAMQIVSKTGSDPASALTLVKASTATLECSERDGACRWGDYPGASPDPGADPTGPSGRVWATGEWLAPDAESSNWHAWTAEVAPVPTTTAVPSLSGQYRNYDPNAADVQIKPGLQVTNTSTGSIALSRVTIRYWFTRDGGASTFDTYCDYAAVNCANVTHTVVNLATPRNGADAYLQVGFTSGAGTLAPGTSTGDMQLRLNKTDWSALNEADDYSHSSSTSYTDWSKVTIYVDGVLTWGTEPA